MHKWLRESRGPGFIFFSVWGLAIFHECGPICTPLRALFAFREYSCEDFWIGFLIFFFFFFSNVVLEGTGAFIVSPDLCLRRRRRQAYDIAIPGQVSSQMFTLKCLFLLSGLENLTPISLMENLAFGAVDFSLKKINLQNSMLALLPYLKLRRVILFRKHILIISFLVEKKKI